ncbi:MAG: glycosyltransferase family 39 protein [Candidatus Limnocylindrales bacterium]
MIRGRGWLVPLGLYALAVLAGAVAAGGVAFPPTEVSAYVLGVARNLVTGHGLASDAIWSYASGPFVLPRPAFDIWQPMPGFLAALPMAVAGPSFAAAQASSVLVGALLAPLTWWVACIAAWRNGLGGPRATIVAIGAGLVAATFGPFLTAMAGPDSFVPFTVFVVGACLLVPRALQGGRGAGIALGVALGLAYLSRQEAIWFGLAYVLLAGGGKRPWSSALRWPLVAGVIVAGPWIVRNALTFDGGGVRQALENAWLTTNTDIFAFATRPSATTFVAQGPAVIAAHIGTALVHDLADVLIVPAAPIGVVGLVALVALRRTAAVREAGPLRALLLGGAITYLVTSVAFPVATLWGTFQHASGPLLSALIILSALGLDAFVARVRSRRGWSRENAWLAPLATLAMSVPVAVLSVALVAANADAEAGRMASLRAAIGTLDAPVITDHPTWVSMTLEVPALAYPHEDDTSVTALAGTFGARWLLLTDADIAGPSATPSCFERQPIALPGARLFGILPGCIP